VETISVMVPRRCSNKRRCIAGKDAPFVGRDKQHQNQGVFRRNSHAVVRICSVIQPNTQPAKTVNDTSAVLRRVLGNSTCKDKGT